MALSTEGIIAIVGVFVSFPPAIILFWKFLGRKQYYKPDDVELAEPPTLDRNNTNSTVLTVVVVHNGVASADTTPQPHIYSTMTPHNRPRIAELDDPELPAVPPRALLPVSRTSTG
ncbi:hypothetical protein EDC01DRAFT_727915 [Geopyxis carbonaria]|nr:hypothetical protein EDC01DRAFT_727915 [Geopyxis carbonaria]